MRITKLIAAVIGVPMIVGSFALAIGGILAIAVPDDNGWIESGPIGLETDSAALVGNDIEIDFGETIADGRTFVSWGEIPARIEVSSHNDKNVFVGIAHKSDADAFLAGVARDELSALDRHDDHKLVHIGGVYEAASPLESDIWVASTVDGVLEWDIRDGEWAIVAVNEDGSPGIDVGLTAAAKIPFLTAIGVILIVAGVIGVSVGTLLTYYGVRRVTPRQPATPSPDPIVA